MSRPQGWGWRAEEGTYRHPNVSGACCQPRVGVGVQELRPFRVSVGPDANPARRGAQDVKVDQETGESPERPSSFMRYEMPVIVGDSSNGIIR